MIWLREWRQTKGIFIRFLVTVLLVNILSVVISSRGSAGVLLTLQVLLGIIFAVHLASYSFFKEIQQDTFGFLLSKPLKKYKILLGKISIALLQCCTLILVSMLITVCVQILKFSDITFTFIKAMKILSLLLPIPFVYFCISLFFAVLTESRNKSVVLAYIIGTIFILSAPKIYHPGGLSLEPKVILFYFVIPVVFMTTAFLIFEEKEAK